MTEVLRVAPIDYPFPEKPKALSSERETYLKTNIKRLLKEKNATLIAHYYTEPEIQALAEETGGCVSDSLEMARFGRDDEAQTLIVAGVRFMGETAKILSPEKTVLMPTLEATCSLDLGCPEKEFSEFCDAHPDLITIEPGIGYAGGHWARWKVFESYAIMHAYNGLSAVGTCKQDWYEVVIPNYFDLDEFLFEPEKKEDYFLFLGRVYAGKGIDIAVQVTEKIGAKLVVAGQNPEKRIFPKHVEFVGYADVEKRKQLMSRAKASFVASTYLEPFGGVQVENLISGTPTITTDWGAFTENNIEGMTGFRCRTFADFVNAAKNIDSINPYVCRGYGEQFSLEKIAPKYEKYFQDVLNVHTNEGEAFPPCKVSQHLSWCI